MHLLRRACQAATACEGQGALDKGRSRAVACCQGQGRAPGCRLHQAGMSSVLLVPHCHCHCHAMCNAGPHMLTLATQPRTSQPAETPARQVRSLQALCLTLHLSCAGCAPAAAARLLHVRAGAHDVGLHSHAGRAWLPAREPVPGELHVLTGGCVRCRRAVMGSCVVLLPVTLCWEVCMSLTAI